MVNITSYQKSYFDLLVGMYQSQYSADEDYILPETLPEIGYMAFEGAIPVCAGYLRRVEGGYAQIDGLVSNADVDSDIRHEHMTKLVDKLIEDAVNLGIIGLVCYTDNQDVLKRAKGLGFIVTSKIVIVKTF